MKLYIVLEDEQYVGAGFFSGAFTTWEDAHRFGCAMVEVYPDKEPYISTWDTETADWAPYEDD